MSVFAIGVRPPLRLLVAFLRAIALVSPLLLPPAASAVDLWAAHAPVCDACSFPEEAYKYLDANTDRKSTRLNSSHSQISYAVFCLKKKKKPSYARHSCV